MMMHVLLSFLTFVAMTDLCAQTPDFVAGQVMLKFVAGSAADEAVSLASQASPPNLAALEPIIENLEGSIQLPLQVVQISSGNWLVLSLDLQALGERSAQRLRGRENVATVQARASEAGEPGGTPQSLEILVNFAPGSTEDKDVEKARDSGTAEPLTGLISALEQDLGLPLSGSPDAGGLTLQVDLKALTLDLVESLKALPEVESAQPNYVLRGFRPGSP